MNHETEVCSRRARRYGAARAMGQRFVAIVLALGCATLLGSEHGFRGGFPDCAWATRPAESHQLSGQVAGHGREKRFAKNNQKNGGLISLWGLHRSAQI